MSLAGMEPEALISIGFYVLCSSMALVANKMVMFHLQIPGMVFCLQIAVTIAFIFFASFIKLIEVDSLNWKTTRVFLPYIASFVLSLYSNGKALTVSNVETVIVFRACSPLLVSVLEWQFLGRELPNKRSLLALLGLVFGAVGYVLVDSEFKLHGVSAYKWVTLNLMGVTFEMTYGKRLLQGAVMKSPVWGATLYTNFLAFVPMLIVALSTGEVEDMKQMNGSQLSAVAIAWLVISCVIGVGISWSGWNCRNGVSATVFTILGVVCKILSVLMNMMIWNHHSTTPGLVALGLCLVSSALYQQAPMRADAQALSETSKLVPDTNKNKGKEGDLYTAGANEASKGKPVALGLCLVSSALYQQAPMRADAQALSETSKLVPDTNKNKGKEGTDAGRRAGSF